ncbi:MAG TPA: MBL fold metallo-hydrolase [Burkholderiaceae bacterium]|nr:MBL fold metallo-hydrolase [Burkholderiaceae bacterium]
MRQLLDPQLINGALGDPGLYVDLRDERRALLVDLGDLRRLPPRKLMRLTHVFVSHTHVDHFVGFDQLLRVLLGRKDRLVLWGGPGFADQVEHKLRAYTWNVIHRYEVPMTLEVNELALDGSARHASFCSHERFERRMLDRFAIEDGVLHADDSVRVRAAFVDHEMPCLAFAIEETTQIKVWRTRLDALGLPTGPWLTRAKQAIRAGAPDDTAIEIRWRDRDGEHLRTHSLGALRPAFEPVAGRRIGYVTDMRFTGDNLRALDALLADVDLLFIESVFLHEDVDHATRKNHLTARQSGEIAQRLRAKTVVPTHFSPRYEDRAADVIAEVADAAGSDVTVLDPLAAAPAS